jgi:hypothetical protein
MIQEWKSKLELLHWNITTEEIDPNAVAYSDDCPEKDRYFIGVYPMPTTKKAVIYHDRPLTEEDIVHELLHLRHPDWSEFHVNVETERLIERLIYMI